jgi:hypothetical protein
MTTHLTQMKEIINQLANIKMPLLKTNYLFSKEYGIIVNCFNVLF